MSSNDPYFLNLSSISKWSTHSSSSMLSVSDSLPNTVWSVGLSSTMLILWIQAYIVMSVFLSYSVLWYSSILWIGSHIYNNHWSSYSWNSENCHSKSNDQSTKSTFYSTISLYSLQYYNTIYNHTINIEMESIEVNKTLNHSFKCCIVDWISSFIRMI